LAFLQDGFTTFASIPAFAGTTIVLAVLLLLSFLLLLAFLLLWASGSHAIAVILVVVWRHCFCLHHCRIALVQD
jgi:hypothetical protein